MATTMDKFLDFNTFRNMGWLNILWVVGILVLALAVKAGKIGFVVIGPNEKGAREIFGVPVWPVFRAAHFFVQGLLNVRKTAVMPTPVDFHVRVAMRTESQERVVVTCAGTVLVRVLRTWKAIKASIYNTLDEDKKDLENPERTKQTRAVLQSGIRSILTGETCVDVLTQERLETECAQALLERFGSEIDLLLLDDTTAADMQLVKEGLLGLTEQLFHGVDRGLRIVES